MKDIIECDVCLQRMCDACADKDQFELAIDSLREALRNAYGEVQAAEHAADKRIATLERAIKGSPARCFMCMSQDSSVLDEPCASCFSGSYFVFDQSRFEEAGDA